MKDTHTMRRLSRSGPPMPTRGIAPGVGPPVVSVFAILGALQSPQPRLVVAAALAVTVAAACLMTLARPVLLPFFAALSLAGVVVNGHGNSPNMGWFAVCAVIAWCALVADTRFTVALWAAVVVTVGLEWLLTTRDSGWVAWIAGTTLTGFGCLLARRDRDLAEQLRVAQEGLADRARAEERNRIARELHDVIAHSLTVSLLHVSSARLAMDEDPDVAARAMAEAERLGRECLDEVRQVVGLLRHADATGAAPLPGAAQLMTLVQQYHRAGADVALDEAGDSSKLTATVGLAVYRILQEALTNAARHAAGTRTRASLSVTATSAVLVVDSAGPAGVATTAGSGLLGMRERAEVLGGTCTAGPVPGGWRVRAELPLQPSSRPVAYL